MKLALQIPQQINEVPLLITVGAATATAWVAVR